MRFTPLRTFSVYTLLPSASSAYIKYMAVFLQINHVEGLNSPKFTKIHQIVSLDSNL
jgi:hypothetical protein